MDDDLDLFSAFDASETLTVAEKTATTAATKRKGAPAAAASSPPAKKQAQDATKPADDGSSAADTAASVEKKKEQSSTDVKIVEGKHIDATPAEAANGEANKVVATGTTAKNLISFSVYPPDYEVKSCEGASKTNPAKTYPFTLDPFQQQAVDYIEAGESVLVSAHTSAGKTAVAEYAIAKSLRDKQRVIYTSPIKALSNQKYRDLEEEFGDVGLMTGDITINPSATCLIMTTEILRSMLYRGSEVMREVAWVIYDEIHYMRDKERGVVWEESIILLPHKVRFVFLSATIPNSKEFAGWICHIHHQPCHVVYTDYRPTPLQHYVFPAGGNGLHLVVDEKGKFREDNFQKAIATLSASAATNEGELESYGSGNKRRKAKSGGNQKKKVGTDVYRIVKLIMERQYDPVIIFSFSKRECESYALLMSKLDFNTEDEKLMVDQVFKNAMDSLSDDDKTLPQVDSILPLLRRGIGIHHGGLLPILKEVIEIMFAEGLLKCLFATETFSMGLNMPAKTVVFTNCRKYDGKDFRWITSGEYIQMSGRAGRRSLDSRGIVIQMLSEQMEPQVAKSILYGQADPLFSSFHLGYNMLLNLLRVEDADPEYMIKQSFHQFQNEQAAPVLEGALERTREERDQIVIKNEEEVAEYYYLSRSLVKLKEEFLSIRNKPDYVVRFLNGGRLVKVYSKPDEDESKRWDWGVIVNFTTKNASDSTSANPDTIVHVLLNCANTPISKAMVDGASPELPSPAPAGTMGLTSATNCEMKICPVPLEMLDLVSSLRVYIPKDLRTLESRQAVGKSVKEVLRRFPQGVPLLDPLEDMDIKDEQFARVIKKIAETEEKVKASAFHAAKDKDSRFALYNLKMESEAKMRELERQIKESKSLVLRDDLRRRRRVLRRLEFVGQDSVIQRKGRTACEVSTADELLVTEMIFNGQFNDLSVNETVALLSCLINTEKQKEGQKPPATESLEAPVRQLRETARRISKVMQDAKIAIDVDEYAESFNTSLVDVVIAWCEGAKFSQICKMTDSFEGTIIRCLRRLEELLRQLTVAAHTIGDVDLEKKFEEGGKKLKRDIVFAASLYL
uniref:Helicase ATP-binding domain-containing protein n=1 Tax=Globisporangium ultimum (strain ATCC 200006 / CBS 805.95 / DAOM BR144) TaxID=431595 RepID=K3W7C0_GLOUD